MRKSNLASLSVQGEAKPPKVLGDEYRSRRQILADRVEELDGETLVWCDPRELYEKDQRLSPADYPGLMLEKLGYKRRPELDRHHPGFEVWTIPTHVYQAWEKENVEASRRQMYGKTNAKYDPSGSIIEAEAAPISEKDAYRHTGGDFFEGQPVDYNDR